MLRFLTNKQAFKSVGKYKKKKIYKSNKNSKFILKKAREKDIHYCLRFNVNRFICVRDFFRN